MQRVNPRALCVKALLRWEAGREFADAILHDALARARAPALDRAFFTETFYGILRNLGLLDFWISRLREGSLDPETHQLVRLGLYQIFRMRIPHHASVNETVNLAGRRHGLVNALLRRAIREEERLIEAERSAPEYVRLSHPEHLLARWRRSFGGVNGGRLGEWNNQPAEVFARVNTLVVTPDELLRTTETASPFHGHPMVLKVSHVPLPWIMQGLCYVQDPSTLGACELLDPRPGEAVLDACAAPGGKTSYLAQLAQNEAELVACDASAERLRRLEENLRRLHVAGAKIVQVDWLAGPAPFAAGSFDKILIDAPCSNTGVIRRRIDVRWRLSPDDFQKLPLRQFALVKAIAPLLKPGGRLVYSTCSIEPEENEGVVEAVTRELPELRLIESRSTFPFRDAVDGSFAASFQRDG